MPRPTHYSSSRPPSAPSRAHAMASAHAAAAQNPAPAASAATATPTPSLATAPAPVQASSMITAPASQRRLWAALAVLAVALCASLGWSLHTAPRPLTQKDIDAAVRHTLMAGGLPSAQARAVEAIAPSVVRVVGYTRSKNGKADIEHGVGTGVIIVEDGTILTNLHVVSGASRIALSFHDGLETSARITGVQPHNDLAVLKADKVPDDVQAATLRSTQDLRPGDHVVAVGFPFGIGPSASAGVVSGLERVFEAPHGTAPLSNLIQFDAAANPGNSGGPLVTLEGEVVGIVTAILNPTPARTFIGIGFAVPIENAASAVGMPPF